MEPSPKGFHLIFSFPLFFLIFEEKLNSLTKETLTKRTNLFLKRNFHFFKNESDEEKKSRKNGTMMFMTGQISVSTQN